MEGLDRQSALRAELLRRLGEERFDLLIGSQTSFSLQESKLTVGCPSKFQQQWLRRRLSDTLKNCTEAVWGRQLALDFVVDPQLCQEKRPETDPAPERDAASGPDAESESQAPATLPMPSSSPSVTPAKTSPQRKSASSQREKKPSTAPSATSSFHNFVVGGGNELAYRTTQSIAENPGQYGPLLLFGPPGVGKTHLQYALVRKVRQGPGNVRCLRLTAEQFTGEFLSCLERRALPGFRQKYRTIDVLLVDDIQFLVNKRATLEELLYTIDTLHERGKQVVLTCDRSPGDLQSLSTELVTRISGGLAIPLQSPDYATRLGLVKQLCTRLNMRLDDEVQAIVATQATASARQIQGALNRLLATSQAEGRKISAELARTTMAEFAQQNSPVVRLADIQRAVCKVFGMEPANLKSARKSRSVTEPRMLAMWLARKYTRAALGEIGEYFGRRSHSTVISAHKKIEGMVSKGEALKIADQSCPVEEAIRQVEQAIRTA